MVGRCERCGASIFWVWSQDGKRVPLDAIPLPDAVLEGWVVDGIIGRPYEPLFDSPARTRYQVHWVTCLDADRQPQH